MSSASFAIAGEDPLLAPDQLTGAVDPSLPPPPDPLLMSALDPGNLDPMIYGPTVSQLGADPTQPNIAGTASPVDPSATGASPTTNAAPGTSIWDSILGLAKVGTNVAAVATGRSAAIANPPAASARVANAKTNSIFAAGNGGGLMIAVIVIFLALVAWAEWGSGA